MLTNLNMHCSYFFSGMAHWMQNLFYESIFRTKIITTSLRKLKDTAMLLL
jgi:hypothetical protein